MHLFIITFPLILPRAPIFKTLHIKTITHPIATVLTLRKSMAYPQILKFQAVSPIRPLPSCEYAFVVLPMLLIFRFRCVSEILLPGSAAAK